MKRLDLQKCIVGSVFTNCYFLKNKETEEGEMEQSGSFSELSENEEAKIMKAEEVLEEDIGFSAGAIQQSMEFQQESTGAAETGLPKPPEPPRRDQVNPGSDPHPPEPPRPGQPRPNPGPRPPEPSRPPASGHTLRCTFQRRPVYRLPEDQTIRLCYVM